MATHCANELLTKIIIESRLANEFNAPRMKRHCLTEGGREWEGEGKRRSDEEKERERVLCKLTSQWWNDEIEKHKSSERNNKRKSREVSLRQEEKRGERVRKRVVKERGGRGSEQQTDSWTAQRKQLSSRKRETHKRKTECREKERESAWE